MVKSKLSVQVVAGSRLHFQQDDCPPFEIVFQRTLRIPDDGKDYPLPPALGPFPLRKVSDYADKVPPAWLESEGVFMPIYQREAMWLSFNGAHWNPHALKVAAGCINAVSGEEWEAELKEAAGQDYLVYPAQPWLDGFNTGEGLIRQFVAMPLGSGYTVEGQVTGKEELGGLQFVVFPPKPGRFSPPLPYFGGISYPLGFLHGPHTADVERLVCQELIVGGKISEQTLLQAQQGEAQKAPGAVLRSLLSNKAVDASTLEEMVARVNAATLGVPFVTLDNLDVDLARDIPECIAFRYRVVPTAVSGNVLTLAMYDPLDVLAVDDIKLITGFDIRPVQATGLAISAALSTLYGDYDPVEVEETMKDISAMDFGCMDFEPEELGLAAGGQMKQAIHPDPFGFDTWDTESCASIDVHLVDIFTWARITGEAPPDTPVNAAAYTAAGYPWFEIYNDLQLGDISPSEILAQLSSMAALDAQHGLVSTVDSSLSVSSQQVVTYVKSDKPLGHG
jgi:hypothetical protein